MRVRSLKLNMFAMVKMGLTELTVSMGKMESLALMAKTARMALAELMVSMGKMVAMVRRA